MRSSFAAQQTFVSTLSQRVSMRSRLVDVEAGTKAAMIDAQETLQEAERDLVSQKGTRRQGPHSMC
ncbi:hypothetical protein ASD00_31430 [Ensifer sp. Root31]|uniref:hypothetical protein n=1 Tax=Ensifer sp. Root31 TaxID=1736512 RepID=UPI00070976EE|nr:hypothetical protein [Ensifer sp. Root31]KQU86401.1 hypothetical protein ASD00_31430 [Ensifer sp. Root31]